MLNMIFSTAFWFNMLFGVFLITESVKAVYFGQIFSTWMNILWLIRHKHMRPHTQNMSNSNSTKFKSVGVCDKCIEE